MQTINATKMKGIFCMKRFLLSLWNMIDPVYFHCTRLCYVPENEKNNTVFRVRLTRYKGRSTVLDDGTPIKKNDVLLKIHLHNVRMLTKLYAIHSEMKRAAYLYHLIKKSLPSLAQFMMEHKKYSDIQAIIGITSLYRGANRLRFEKVLIKSSYYRTFKKCTFFLINLLANSSTPNPPVYLFMSKSKLFDKYT